MLFTKRRAILLSRSAIIEHPRIISSPGIRLPKLKSHPHTYTPANPHSLVFFLLPVLIMNPNIIIGLTEARQCYVCGAGSDAVFRVSGDHDLFFSRSSSSSLGAEITSIHPHSRPPSCLDFDRIDTLDEFIRECPDGYEGCLTQIDGMYTHTCVIGIHATKERFPK